MKTFLLLILTVFIATGAMFAGLQHEPVLGYTIGLGAWALFFLCWHRRGKRKYHR